MNNSIKSFINETNSEVDPSKIINILTTHIKKYGCEFLAFGPATNESVGAMIAVDPTLPYITNYPNEWITRYKEKNYLEIDPVLKYAKIVNHAFTWRELQLLNDFKSEEIDAFWDDAKNHGLVCGVSVPLHGPGPYNFVMSVASSKPAICSACMGLDKIQLVAYQFYLAYTSPSKEKEINEFSSVVIETEKKILTEREKEILKWSALGKSAWDISVILNISENTVNFHLKNIVKKLDVTNKVAAVVKAIRLGIITCY